MLEFKYLVLEKKYWVFLEELIFKNYNYKQYIYLINVEIAEFQSFRVLQFFNIGCLEL